MNIGNYLIRETDKDAITTVLSLPPASTLFPDVDVHVLFFVKYRLLSTLGHRLYASKLNIIQLYRQKCRPQSAFVETHHECPQTKNSITHGKHTYLTQAIKVAWFLLIVQHKT